MNEYITALDVVGLVPGAGEAADALNGIIYLVQGDGTNATISFAATIPVVGWVGTGSRLAVMVVKSGNKFHKLYATYDPVNNLVNFGSRNSSKLRTVLGITNNALDAHHIIPWQKCWDHDVIQKAALDAELVTHNGSQFLKGGFHLDHPLNGMPVTSTRANIPDYQHANHPNYDNQVEATLEEIQTKLIAVYGSWPQVPTGVARDYVTGLQNYLRNLIDANPNTKINDLEISYPIP